MIYQAAASWKDFFFLIFFFSFPGVILQGHLSNHADGWCLLWCEFNLHCRVQRDGAAHARLRRAPQPTTAACFSLFLQKSLLSLPRCCFSDRCWKKTQEQDFPRQFLRQKMSGPDRFCLGKTPLTVCKVNAAGCLQGWE